ncbi:hypothetical protein PR202_ga27302 [Eleusine coracana subsp. coracana]|uniref:DUF7032 domain-containing protein n=1 Tax=Eleusine coracana subsp. coracana TaxID=191504 RepID=A0AAV5DFQ9_ELECO|nr:hypothetical protein PR202_ga27302 [Eleusine coracana subsp. coracana]
MVPAALDAARSAGGFPGRWKAIAAKLERLPSCLSDLSSHPCFARNALCRELLQSVASTVAEAAELAARCREPPASGKLQTQSAVDAVAGKLELNLRDCALLVKTGVLSDAAAGRPDVRELLARLQIGPTDAKDRAVDGLLEAMEKDERSVLSVLGRASVSAMVQLLTSSSSARVREKAAAVVCRVAESEVPDLEALLVSEGVLPPLVRLAESGGLVGREKAAVALHRLSSTSARAVVGHGGAGPLVEICRTGGHSHSAVAQSAAAGALTNLSAVPELRHALAHEGIVRVMVGLLLDCGSNSSSKEHAAECLRNLTSDDDALRRAVVSEGGLRGLLLYIDDDDGGPSEAAVSALRNLVGAVSPDTLVSLGVIQRLAHVLTAGSTGAQQQAAAAICAISRSTRMKRAVGEHGCVPLLARMLEAKSGGAREAAAQALASLATCAHNAREMKKDDKCVPGLVQLLDPSPANTANKYAILCLLALASDNRCKKLMIAHGAIGYLKKLSDMNVAGAAKLLDRLDRGSLRTIFSTTSK